MEKEKEKEINGNQGQHPSGNPHQHSTGSDLKKADGCASCGRKEAGGCAGCSRQQEGDCDGCDRKGVDAYEAEAEGCAGCASGGCCRSDAVPDIRGKLHSFNYFDDIPGGYADDDMVEVNFKNTRKGYYLNSTHIPLEVGDMVAVEAQPGHDIGRVTLTGALVRLQMRKANIKPDAETRRVFRKAKPADIERYQQARARENDTMIRSRKIAASLNLNMKIGDVEYQGDGNKAIFYYIADERVDFRQLIKVLAETFKVRIEMKQIGARQEAGRIGGIGPCGRPLCCTTWMTNFVSVSTGAARYQDISLNPQKLAGQCAKLKCCLNFEVDAYVEASKKLPPKEIRLETADSTYFYFKADIFKREITYSTDKNIPANLVTIPASRAFEVIALNKAGEKPLALKEETDEEKPAEYADILGQDSLTRFDKKKKKKKPQRPGGNPNGNGGNQNGNGNGGNGGNPNANGGNGGNPNGGGKKPGQQPKPQQRDRQQKPQNGQQRPQNGQQRPQNGRQPHPQNQQQRQQNGKQQQQKPKHPQPQAPKE